MRHSLCSDITYVERVTLYGPRPGVLHWYLCTSILLMRHSAMSYHASIVARERWPNKHSVSYGWVQYFGKVADMPFVWLQVASKS